MRLPSLFKLLKVTTFIHSKDGVTAQSFVGTYPWRRILSLRKSVPLIHRFHVCKSVYSLKLICNPEINTWGLLLSFWHARGRDRPATWHVYSNQVTNKPGLTQTSALFTAQLALRFLLFCALCEWISQWRAPSAPKTKKAGRTWSEKPFSGSTCEFTINRSTAYMLNRVMYRLVDKNMTKGSQAWASPWQVFPQEQWLRICYLGVCNNPTLWIQTTNYRER